MKWLNLKSKMVSKNIDWLQLWIILERPLTKPCYVSFRLGWFGHRLFFRIPNLSKFFFWPSANLKKAININSSQSVQRWLLMFLCKWAKLDKNYTSQNQTQPTNVSKSQNLHHQHFDHVNSKIYSPAALKMTIYQSASARCRFLGIAQSVKNLAVLSKYILKRHIARFDKYAPKLFTTFKYTSVVIRIAIEILIWYLFRWIKC